MPRHAISWHASASIAANRDTRLGSATLAVGAMVLLAFPTDIWLERDRGKGRTVKLHMLPLKGSTVGKILSQLLSTYLKR